MPRIKVAVTLVTAAATVVPATGASHAKVSEPAGSNAQFKAYARPTARYLASSCVLDLSRRRDYSSTGKVNDCGTKVTLSQEFTKLSVPHTWRTWSCPPISEDCKPDVLSSGNASAATIDFGTAVTTGGFECEPGTLQVATFRVDFYSGPLGSGTLLGSITRDIDGKGGASLFGATAKDGFQSAVVTNDADDYFAIAQIRV